MPHKRFIFDLCTLLMRTGIANLPLHSGKCPAWLFQRMKPLAGAISEVILNEFGADEFLRRLASPFFFQALGNVLGFDWHSSGLTTTTLGALKESLNEKNLGIRVCGGKGKTSRKTPSEIEKFGDIFNLGETKIKNLTKASRLSAKVDNSLIQSGHQIYTHGFILTEKGKWAVIQQGMRPETQTARRYHWLSDDVNSFVEEPHSAICDNTRKDKCLNMTSKNSEEARKVSVDLVQMDLEHLRSLVRPKGQLTLNILNMPQHHEIKFSEKINFETLRKAHEVKPSDYEELISVQGVGPKTVRALALISELIYGAGPSWQDPARFSFAHGGKDGYPYPVDRKLYDSSIQTLQTAIENAKLGHKEKLAALKRLRME